MSKWARVALFVACFGGTAAILIIARNTQNTLERGLPPRQVAAGSMEAFTAALEFAGDITRVYAVVGTGSMAPYIPAAQLGHDPKTTVVAYAIGRKGAKFADITPGALCVYQAEWDAKISVIHGAIEKTQDGWIMSGLHNARSEAHWRVTQDNFRAIVEKTFTWEQGL